jgi:hypothetical protein
VFGAARTYIERAFGPRWGIKMTLTKRKAQWWLAGVWLSGFALLSLVLLYQVSMTNMYEGRSKELWDWFLPATTPTLGLMIATLVGGSQDGGRVEADKGVFLLSLLMSLGYLVVLGVLLALVGLKYSWAPIDNSAPLLATVQGLVTLAIGAFFVRAKGSEPK